MSRKDKMGGKNVDQAVSRRGFFKGTAAVVGAGLVANSKLSVSQAPAPAAASSHIAGYSGDGDWLGTAPVIADSQIAKTVETDVLVLGGGHAGVLATLGASDKGVKVAVIEAQDEAGFCHRLLAPRGRRHRTRQLQVAASSRVTALTTRARLLRSS